jgi:beta-lactamase superfamily II metal-dependent hydrolase
MADFFEIDFLSVHPSKSGDAIGIRYETNGAVYVHVVDGGYKSTATDLQSHLHKYYSTSGIDHVVVTHPDQDHAEGLGPILENFRVGALWMLRPWQYAAYLLPAFPRYSSAEGLAKKFRDAYPYIDELEKIALRKRITILEPFQGQRIGAFTVLSPSQVFYFQQLIASDKTPQPAAGTLSGLVEAAKRATAFIRVGWGAEVFPTEGTSEENEMSVIQYAHLCNRKILLTADAGRSALAEAADYAPTVGLTLPGIDRFQVPHHGGRHNVSTEILDRWLGQRLASKPAQGEGTFSAIISSAKEDTDHPREVVVRAMIHRGANVVTTEDGAKRTSHNAPDREGWSAATPEPYPDEQEE